MTARQVAQPPLPVPAAGPRFPGRGRAERRLRDKPRGPNALFPLYPLSAASAKCSGARRKVAEPRGAGGYLPGSRSGSEVFTEHHRHSACNHLLQMKMRSRLVKEKSLLNVQAFTSTAQLGFEVL